ncbi:hypothetical protein ANN_22110 [Periplaneta americana]|uniref:Uncharacterized protein n=1 Tax=Periplaneta americana TaxID=6978 RepID=A0ABQ8S803_PERAM|nr:hypothetical protein ANN_22110 [Periplaneta americana]
MAGLCEGGNEPPGSLKVMEREEKRLEAFEMWIWRRMERMKWTDRIRKEAVLERVDEERIMLKLIRKRKRNWLGHLLRRNCLLKDALEGMCLNEMKVLMPDPGSSTESYLAFPRIGLRENPGKTLNQRTCPDRDSNPGHLVSRPDALTVAPQGECMCKVRVSVVYETSDNDEDAEERMGNPVPARSLLPSNDTKGAAWLKVSVRRTNHYQRKQFGVDPPSGPSMRKWYLDMLQLWLLPQLEQDIEDLIFQQDWATAHYHLDVRNELNTQLPRRWIGRAGREDLECLHWPPSSLDLTLCDFFLWGFIKQVYQPPLPPTIEDLRVRTTEVIALVDGPMLQRVWQKIDYRLHVCRVIQGAHIEHM